jgi:putative ABC transport system ATP-binding protein
MPPIVALRAVTKSYREGEAEHSVLTGIDASFESGEFIVLVGKSGSGKSTLLNLVSGIDLPTTGDVVVMQRSMGSMSEEARTLFRREHVGFVFQTYNLIPTLTVEENLLLPLELRGQLDDEARRRACALLGEVGLAARGQSFPDALSGGEQQRIAVARALVHEPTLVLADEPTGNLDAQTGREVLDLIDRLTRERLRTVLVVTHDRDLIERADRVFVLEGGRLRPWEVPDGGGEGEAGRRRR